MTDQPRNDTPRNDAEPDLRRDGQPQPPKPQPQPQTKDTGQIDSRTEKAQEEAAKDRATQGGYQ